jgi:hypothetical protein
VFIQKKVASATFFLDCSVRISSGTKAVLVFLAWVISVGIPIFTVSTFLWVS